jgi:hypothetical protein
LAATDSYACFVRVSLTREVSFSSGAH